MISYYGDFAEDDTVLIPFNTFDSNDPSASATITNLADADIMVHKDAGLTQIATDGATVVIDFDGITGNHMITIDTSAHADYSTGSEYAVRIEGTTVDAGTINAWVGSFSIERAGGALALIKAGVTLAAGAVTDASLAGNMEVVFETDFATNYNTTRNAWVNNYTDIIGTMDAAAFGADFLTSAKIADGAFVAANFAASSLDGKGDWNTVTPDAAGVAPTAAEVVNEWETQSQADPTGFHVNVLEYNSNALTDGDSPSTRTQVGNLATGSAAISVQAASYVLTTGTQSSGTVSDTETLNGTYHEHTDTAGTTDLYYQFDVTGAGVATSADFNIAVQGINDSLNVFAWDWVASGWDQLGSVNGATNQIHNDETVSLLTRHTGTGANIGLVRIRFQNTGLTTSTLSIDQIFASYSIVSQTVGYALGAIWIDTTHGISGTESYVNGVADNPSDTVANVNTMSGNLNIHRFQVSPESTVTFAAGQTDEVWSGDGWTLALGGQDISQSHFYHCNDISGIGTTASGEAHILDSHIGATTLGACHITRSTFMSTFTGGAAANYFIEDSRSGVAGAGSPTLTFSGNGASSNINARNWFGGGTWVFDADCTASIEVNQGGTHTITTGGGDVEFRGNPKALIVTTSLTGTTNIIVGNGAPITINGTGGTVNIYGVHNGITDNSTGTTVTDLGQDITDIKAMNLGIIYGTTSGTPTTTATNTDLTGYLDDELTGRVIIFTGGTANGQASDITDYAATSGVVTYTALTTAPAASDPFKIV